MLDELYTDEVEPLEGEPVDALGVRHLLIELGQTARKREQVERTLAAVAESYRERIDTLAARESAIRDSLRVYVEANGKVSFPDVGGVHMSQRKGRLRIADSVAFAAWAVEHGFTVEVPDAKAAQVEAEHLFEHGELAPGMEWHEPEPSLVVKGVK